MPPKNVQFGIEGPGPIGYRKEGDVETRWAQLGAAVMLVDAVAPPLYTPNAEQVS